jgi:2-hydroxychromene-2-carboxylate isomerase
VNKLELFWDVGSPYSYIAVAQAPKRVAEVGGQLVLRPFLLGGVFKATGNKMPASVQAKGSYMLKDLARWRDRLGLSFRLPNEGTPFPLSTVLPMRVATAADRAGVGEACCAALYQTYWGEGRDVSQPAVLEQMLADAGLDAELLRKATEQETKDALRANTDEAVARGAFGAPTCFVGEEMFWGSDRLHLAVEALGSA